MKHVSAQVTKPKLLSTRRDSAGIGIWLARRLQFFLAASCLSSTFVTEASDWPQFLGPNRNGTCAEPNLAASWPKGGPPILWRRAVGQGFSGPIVASRKLILFHRVEDREVVECLDAETGRGIWTNGYPTAYHDDFGFDEGPRATPGISENRVYTFGAEGILSCLDLATGKNLWNVNIKKDFRAPKGFFGIACSPLIEKNALLMIPGGQGGSGIVAFDKITGQVLWKATDDQASYSSPVIATLHGRRAALCLTRSELVAADPAAGTVLFRFPFEPPIHSSVTAATPLVIEDKIFLSGCYDTGCLLLRVKPDNSGCEKLWSGQDILSNHYATSIYHKGFLFGLHGRTDPGLEAPSLRCVDVATGKILWRKDFTAATLTLAGDDLLILSERGEVIRAAASAEEFKPGGEAQILSSQVRAHPALADGRFYARSKDMLVCADLRPPAGK
jgi:outer membrane protein assembly factor BamB